MMSKDQVRGRSAAFYERSPQSLNQCSTVWSASPGLHCRDSCGGSRNADLRRGNPSAEGRAKAHEKPPICGSLAGRRSQDGGKWRQFGSHATHGWGDVCRWRVWSSWVPIAARSARVGGRSDGLWWPCASLSQLWASAVWAGERVPLSALSRGQPRVGRRSAPEAGFATWYAPHSVVQGCTHRARTSTMRSRTLRRLWLTTLRDCAKRDGRSAPASFGAGSPFPRERASAGRLRCHQTDREKQPPTWSSIAAVTSLRLSETTLQDRDPS
jgi:hypothetical protein